MEREYVAFISYRHAPLDSAVAKQLHTLIEQYRIPRNLHADKKRFGNVFRDQEELPVSSDLSEDICRALDNAQYLIVVCSTDTAKSPWVTREIEYFLAHHDRQQVFTVLASGEPVDVFPKQLTQVVNPDGTITDVEPLAVDVRADSVQGMKKKLRREIYRLYAAFLGCPYDSLVQREQRRKRRRLAAMLAVISAVVLSFMALMLAKNYEIDQKNQALEGMNQELEDINAQLEEKNDALAEQKAEVQLRESELLAEEALELLEQGNSLEAVRGAVQALPKPGDERPYYAEAEKVLITAMDAFSPNAKEYSITETLLTQRTPVKDYAMSEDGTRLATIDEYNVVNCFDTVTAEKLWTYQLSTTAYNTNMRLYPYPEKNAVIAYSGPRIAAFSYETGVPLWVHRTDNISVAYMSLDTHTLAYLKEESGSVFVEGESDKSTFSYVFLDIRTGEVKQEVFVAEGSWLSSSEELPHVVFPDYTNYNARNGAFSSDGTLFAGSYCIEQENGEYDLCYFVIDVASGEILQQYAQQIGLYYSDCTTQRMGFVQDNNALMVVRKHPGGYVAGTVDLWDIQNNKLLWQETLPEEENYHIYAATPIGLLSETKLYLAFENRMYVLDQRTGEVLNWVGFDQTIVDMEWVDGFLGVVFADGRYTLGWRNDSGVFFADSIHGIPVSLGENSSAKMWNSGFLHLTVEGSLVQGLDLENPDRERGYVAVIPAEDPNSIKIKRYTHLGKIITPQKAVEMNDDLYLTSYDSRWVSDDVFVFGPISDWSGDETAYLLGVMNMKTAQCEFLNMGGYFGMDDVRLLSDGSGYISRTSSYYGDLLFTDLQTGKQTAIFENPELEMNLAEGAILSEAVYIHDSARLESTGQVFSARLGEGKLTWWLDDKEAGAVTIPEDITAEVFTDYATYRVVAAMANGTILVGDFDQTDTVERTGLVVYDTATGNWYKIPNAETVMLDSPGTRIGLLTTEAAFILYDYVQDKEIHQFSTQLPQNSVDHAQLILEDAYLAVKTKDKQFLIYEVATGEIVYADQMGSYSGGFRIYVDTAGERLFVCDDDSSSAAGFYIHIDSWTKLADIPGLMYYDAQRNEVFCYVDGWNGEWEGIIRYCVPSTQQLVEIGQKYLGE